MKYLYLTSLVLLSIALHAQQSFTARIGPTYSHIQGTDVSFDESIGYYAGIGLQDKFHDVVGINLDLYFLNQRYSINDVDLSVRSINFVFAANIYPFKKGIYMIVGPEFGHTIQIRQDGEKSPSEKQYRFGYVLGLGHQVTDRVTIESRFVRAIDDHGQGFTYNIQLGLVYKMPSKH
jgi:hypothetical protein